MIKKIATFMMGLALISSSSLAFATDNSWQEFKDVWKINGNVGGFGKHKGVSDIWVAGGKAGTTDNSLIGVVKSFINFVLWLLGLITLIMLLWWGFNMVTSAGDNQKFGDGMKILKNAGIGLAFIALSWMMVSMIFWVIWQIGGWVS